MASISLLPILTTFLCSMASLVEGRNTLFHKRGITLDLIHRDSPLSPLYNPALARSAVIANAFHRSISRATVKKTSSKEATTSASDEIESPMVSVPGEYVMKISIGTPPVEFVGIADTGSDLTWTQCSPCTDCYKQNAPIFNPSNSSSYKSFSCQSDSCSNFKDSGSTCLADQKTCGYIMSYGDSSHSEGDLSTETFTFGSSSGNPVSVPGIVFGCGHDNSGTFGKEMSGIIGLGNGQLSIVNQMAGAAASRKFSYCLVPIFSTNATSKFKYGTHAEVVGLGVVTTPMASKKPITYYYLTLESVRVGGTNKTLNYKTDPHTKARKPHDSVEEGNIIIDSGTTLTMLPSDFYNSLEAELKSAIGAETMPDPRGMFSLCYNGTMADLAIPTVTVSFTGADLDLPPSNTFLEVDEGLVCSIFIPSNDLAIFGNLSQQNFLVGYDFAAGTVSFKPADCTQQ